MEVLIGSLLGGLGVYLGCFDELRLVQSIVNKIKQMAWGCRYAYWVVGKSMVFGKGRAMSEMSKLFTGELSTNSGPCHTMLCSYLSWDFLNMPQLVSERV
jgi:hypothetical protein